MPSRDYPATVTEVLDDRLKFNPAALRALRAFRASKPWRGTVEERQQKFLTLNRALAAAYDLREPKLVFGDLDDGDSGASHYIPALHRIVLTGKLSVVTFLHEFAHARGLGERGAVRWSVNLFRRCFPKSFGRLVHCGHTLRKPEDVEAQP